MRTFLAGWLRRQADRLDPWGKCGRRPSQHSEEVAELQEIRRLLRERDRPSRAEVREHVRAGAPRQHGLADLRD